ncbi:MAG: hypothetical protein ABFR63_01490 [Thermodesulfobacteriota bacterium]
MKKGIVSVVLALSFAVASVAVAGSEKCEVTGVDGDTVTMTCKGTKMKAGDKVKVKGSAKKAAAIEGC